MRFSIENELVDYYLKWYVGNIKTNKIDHAKRTEVIFNCKEFYLIPSVDYLAIKDHLKIN